MKYFTVHVVSEFTSSSQKPQFDSPTDSENLTKITKLKLFKMVQISWLILGYLPVLALAISPAAIFGRDSVSVCCLDRGATTCNNIALNSDRCKDLCLCNGNTIECAGTSDGVNMCDAPAVMTFCTAQNTGGPTCICASGIPGEC